MVPVENLKKVEIFEDLSDEELEAISKVAETRRVLKDQVLFSEGTVASQLFILLEGKIAIELVTGHHQEAVFYNVEPGHVFGWSGFIHPFKFTATGKAAADGLIMTIDRESFHRIVAEDHHLGFVVMEGLAEVITKRLRETRIQLLEALNS
jgi:CRP-like cAMP-binding protein